MDLSSREYLHTLENIREELIHFKSEQNKLRFQISDLFEENKRLTSELKENAKLRFLQLSESDVGQLEKALQAAVASKNAALEMWQAALEQLAVQEELLVGKRSLVATERSELEKQCEQMKKEYVTGLNVLSKELADSQTELSRLKKDLEVKNSELEKSQSDMNSTYKELEESKKAVSELSHANDQLKEKLLSFQSSLNESDRALNDCKEKISTLMARNAEFSASMSKLEEQNKKLKSEILIYEKDAKDSLQAAQQAILQKQEVICKEEQYQNEIKMLKASIEVEKENVGRRFKAEMKDIQKKCNEKVQDLMSEIQHLHKTIGEKQNLFERANREKQALESELRARFSESSNGASVSNSTFDDMCKRLTMAERKRDELELRASSLEKALQEVKSTTGQEIQYHLEKQKTLSERLKNLSKDFNQVSSERVKLSDEVAKLRKRTSDLEKELTVTRTKYTKNISALEAQSHHKLKTLQEQLRLAEEHYKSTCSELQKLLDVEFRISSKWKSEVEDLISHSELAVKELSQENVQLKSNNTELINILHQNNLHVPNDILISLM